jgi:hypothetical protein
LWIIPFDAAAIGKIETETAAGTISASDDKAHGEVTMAHNERISLDEVGRSQRRVPLERDGLAERDTAKGCLSSRADGAVAGRAPA